jgi:hypothetical protein
MRRCVQVMTNSVSRASQVKRGSPRTRGGGIRDRLRSLRSRLSKQLPNGAEDTVDRADSWRLQRAFGGVGSSARGTHQVVGTKSSRGGGGIRNFTELLDVFGQKAGVVFRRIPNIGSPFRASLVPKSCTASQGTTPLNLFRHVDEGVVIAHKKPRVNGPRCSSSQGRIDRRHVIGVQYQGRLVVLPRSSCSRLANH